MLILCESDMFLPSPVSLLSFVLVFWMIIQGHNSGSFENSEHSNSVLTCRLQGKSQVVQDELARLGEQLVSSVEGTRAIALELCREFEDKFLLHLAGGEVSIFLHKLNNTIVWKL